MQGLTLLEGDINTLDCTGDHRDIQSRKPYRTIKSTNKSTIRYTSSTKSQPTPPI